METTVKQTCKACGTSVRSDTKSGYCAKCFHQNTDGVKSAYNASRWVSGEAKRSHWSFRGAVLTEVEISAFNQECKCGLCETPFTEAKKCLDHCHETGRYRGALCVQCNAALGKLGDDLDVVIARLQRYKSESKKWK